MRNPLQSRRMARQMISLMKQAGYNDNNVGDLSMQLLVIDDMLIFHVAGGDPDTRSAMEGIIKIVLEENGVQLDLSDL